MNGWQMLKGTDSGSQGLVQVLRCLEVLADAPGNTHLFTRTDAIDRVMSLGAAVTASAGARPLPVCSKLVVS